MAKLMIILLSATLAGLVGGLLATSLVTDAEPANLELGLEDQVQAIQSRLELIEAAMDAQRGDAAAARAVPARSLLPELSALRADLDALRCRMAELPSSLPAATDLSEAPARNQGEAALIDLVDDRIAAIEKAKAAAKRKRDQERAEKRAQDEAAKRVADYTKRLGLDPAQSERLRVSYLEAVTVAAPLYATLKDGDVRADDRLAAIALVRSNRERFDDSSRSILSSSQYERFLSLRRKEDRGLTRWLEDIEGEIRGTKPAR